MQALVKREAREGIWLEDVPEPAIGINDVLIRIKRTAICAKRGWDHPLQFPCQKHR